MKTLPPIPKSVWSPLGKVKVKLVKGLADENNVEIFGRFSGFRRRIEINSKLDPTMLWVTLVHETFHLIMFDSGLRTILRRRDETEDVGAGNLEEMLADSVSTYTVATMLHLNQKQLAALKKAAKKKGK